jgi:outer membrane protein assembly factor BamD
MSGKRWTRVAVWTVALCSLGCPKTLPPDLPPDELFRRGVEAWEKERWTIAETAFERLLFTAPTHSKADSAQFLLADTHARQKAYLTAATEYLKLAQTRPTIDLADDARYRACQAYAELSPRPELDQKYTEEAIAECRSLVVLYPQSPHVAEAQALIARLRNKLARKLYLNSRYYYDRGAYDSAVLYLNDLLKTYPESSVVPAALLALYDAYRRIGYDEEAVEVRQRLLREHPASPEARSLADGPTANGE